MPAPFGLQRILGLLRNGLDVAAQAAPAKVRPGRDRLSTTIEVVETFVGGIEDGGGKRHVGKKALVAVAVGVRGRAIGRVRLQRIRDSSAESLAVRRPGGL